MWYAVVGNGPSSAEPQTREVIDSCRFVIRMTQFLRHFPQNEAGSKVDAWAHYGSKRMLEREGVVPDGLYEVWFTQPSQTAENGGRPSLPSLRVAAEYAEHRYVARVPNSIWQETAYFLRDEGNTELLRPTTGLVAIAMALDIRPVGLVITGFDATTPDANGWGDYNPLEDWRIVDTHDHLAEKRMIAGLVDTGVWCDRGIRTKVRWLGRPKL